MAARSVLRRHPVFFWGISAWCRGSLFYDLGDLIMADAKITILCGCGWGDLAFEISEGDVPVCPDCGYEFPIYEGDDVTVDVVWDCRQ
jgi:hypothetical protein